MKHDITCQGTCNDATVLGTVELPDDANESQIASALSGYLGEGCVCGPAYRHLVPLGELAHGQVPTKAQVGTVRKILADKAKEQGNGAK